MRLVARRPPRLRGRRKQRNEGDPLAQSRKQGPMLFCRVAVGWAKALALAFGTAQAIVRRAHASCTEAITQERVGTAHDRSCRTERPCPRLCPPYNSPWLRACAGTN